VGGEGLKSLRFDWGGALSSVITHRTMAKILIN
jgi:hypothetical protein